MSNRQSADQRLREYAGERDKLTLGQLFANDQDRGRRLRLDAADWSLDFSRQRVTDDVLDALISLAEEAGVESFRNAMFQGEPVNYSESRPALHTALRDPASNILIDGIPIRNGIELTRSSMFELAERIRNQTYIGATGQSITDIVNIGIGGSDLGPRLAVSALKDHPERSSIKLHFVANLDPSELVDTLEMLSAERTLFIVASKSFSTPETIANAELAAHWLTSTLGQDAINTHFVAISSNTERVNNFGIRSAEQIFEVPDWVGGRYSVWSAIGLSVVIAIGKTGFLDLLAGARAMDEHFLTAPLRQNMPVLMGLLAIWNTRYLEIESQAILPYSHRLTMLAKYLQQLDMESLGKQVDRDGETITGHSGSFLWGSVGSNGQHAFFQLLHQGTRSFSADFIAIKQPADKLSDAAKASHQALNANLLAQSTAFAFGRPQAALENSDGLSAHRAVKGNHPHNILLTEKLTARSLGALLAAYEHRVVVQAAILGINPFDQWGVELGKQLAREILPDLESDAVIPASNPNQQLIDTFRLK